VLADSPHSFTDRDSYSRFLVHNKRFHRSVAAATGNQKLVEAIARLFDEMTRFYHLRLDPSDSDEEMRAEHRALASALRERDPDNAERIVLDQIARSQRRVRDALLSGADDGIGALGQMVRLGPS
jgi:DNA-binding GntR family transcriptional regulator